MKNPELHCMDFLKMRNIANMVDESSHSFAFFSHSNYSPIPIRQPPISDNDFIVALDLPPDDEDRFDVLEQYTNTKGDVCKHMILHARCGLCLDKKVCRHRLLKGGCERCSPLNWCSLHHEFLWTCSKCIPETDIGGNIRRVYLGGMCSHDVCSRCIIEPGKSCIACKPHLFCGHNIFDRDKPFTTRKHPIRGIIRRDECKVCNIKGSSIRRELKSTSRSSTTRRLYKKKK